VRGKFYFRLLMTWNAAMQCNAKRGETEKTSIKKGKSEKSENIDVQQKEIGERLVLVI